MPFKLALTIAGAVSLGSFEAGVLFEVVDALGQHNQAAPPEARVYIDVLTGASAGGMTAAIAAQNLLYSSPALTQPYDNAFYNAWVAGVDLDGLLPLQATESADQSVLSADFVKNLVARVLLGRYAQPPVPPAAPHPALTPTGTVRVGLALSNLNGVDYARPLLSGGTFNYTQFGDQIVFELGAASDSNAAWTPIADAAVACGAFPFAFRPCQLTRDRTEYDSPFVAPWTSPTRDFMYTDGGVFQNQPIGLAKNLVDSIDNHQNSDSRAYLFVSPAPVDPTADGITNGANFKAMTAALVNAVYNQAGFQDWIQAESINDAVSLLNQRATQLQALLMNRVIQASLIQNVTSLLLPQFKFDAAQLLSAQKQLQKQFSKEYGNLTSSMGAAVADAWIDALLLLELAANLHEKDEMYIYSITADRRDLAGAGFFAFLGFLDRGFRDHDYDLGRQKAQSFLTTLNQVSGGKLPQLIWTPQPINPIQATPAEGFTAAMIPEPKRKELYQAISTSADKLLAQEGLDLIVRKAVEVLYVDGKIKGFLGL